MSVITHRLNDGTDKALCGEKLSCIPGADVWHILLTSQDFNNDEITQGTRCADCADIQDARNKKQQAELAFNPLYGMVRSAMPEVVHKSDLVAAFNIVAERDKEIAELRQDILRLENVNKRVGEKLNVSEKSYIKARDVIIDRGGKLDDLKRENVRLENELQYAKAELSPIVRNSKKLADANIELMDALDAIDNTVKGAREKLKGE